MRIKILLLLAVLLLPTIFLPYESCFSAEKPVVYFGIGLRYHPIVMYERFQPMMDYLTRNTPYRFELKISRDYMETINFLEEGKTQVSSIGDGGLMKAMLLHGAVPIVKPLNADGKPYYRCYFVVPAGSPLRSLQDLKGKKVAFGSRHSTTGNLIPRDMLRKSGVKLDELGSLTNLRNHSTVVRSVLKGEYDAGAVKSTVADRYKNHGLRVLASSGEIQSIPLVVGKDAPRELVQAITAALTKLNPNNPAHRKIMANWDLEYKYGFVPAKAADYRDVVRMFKSIPLGCGNGCHK